MPDPFVAVHGPVRRTPPLRYPYACAFLDGMPVPKAPSDLARLVRLVAWDMILGAGSDGVDASGVLSLAMRTLHTLQGRGQLPWEMRTHGLVLRAAAWPATPTSATSPTPTASVGCSDFLTRADWREGLEAIEPATFLENALFCIEQSQYPPPQDLLIAAATTALVVAASLCGRAPVSVWNAPPGGERYGLFLESEKS